MSKIDYDRFRRLLTRCQEIASEPGMKPGVVTVHSGLVKPVADVFLKADDDGSRPAHFAAAR